MVYFNFSAKNCSQDKVYAYKTSACQPSCSNQNPVCKLGFMEGCVCKSGTILSGDKCVPIGSCGCIYGGIYLNVIINLFILKHKHIWKRNSISKGAE